MGNEQIEQAVKKHYSAVARKGAPCCNSCGCNRTPGEISNSIGYSDQELANVLEANLGLGCGNPLALGALLPGETVLDLGSGAGIDCFLAAKRVGPSGKVIGVDMTEEMLKKARENAAKHGYHNVEFREGYIDRLPVEEATVDVAISNCVINLAPDKEAVFRDIFRVLRPGGRMYVSDIVLLASLTEEQRSDPELIAGCVGGALLLDDYLAAVESAGLRIESTSEDMDIGTVQYGGLPVMSLKLVARKD